MMPLKDRCEAMVTDYTGFHSCHCQRRGKITENGKQWCSQHAPSAVAAREKTRHDKWQRQWNAEEDESVAKEQKQADLERRAALVPELVAALERLLEHPSDHPANASATPNGDFLTPLQLAENKARAALAHAKAVTG